MKKHGFDMMKGTPARKGRLFRHWLSAVLTLCMLLEPLPLSAMAEGLVEAGDEAAMQDLATAAVDTAAREAREEDLQQGYDAGAAPTMQPPAYGMSGNTLYFTLGEDMREALLSDVLEQLEGILRIKLPFAAADVLAIAEFGSDDEDVDVLPGEEQTDLVAVERLEGDYRITALREFGEAGLVLYTETDSYTLKLLQGWVAEATPEPTIAPDDGSAGDEGRTPSDSPDGEPVPSGREPLEGEAAQSVVTEEVPPAAQSANDTTGDTIPGMEDDEGPHPTEQSPDTFPIGEGIGAAQSADDTTGDTIPGTEADPQKPSPLGKAETDEVPVAAQSANDTTGDIIPGTEDDEGPHPTEQSSATFPIGEGIEAAQSADDTAGDTIPGMEADPQKPSPLGKVDQPKAETDEVPVAAQSAEDTAGDTIPGTEDDKGPHPTEQSPDTFPIGEGIEAAQSAEDTKEEETPETTTDTTPDTTPETPVAYPAQSFTARTSRVRVSVEAGEGAFPEGTRMKVVPVWARDTLNGIRESVSGDDDAVDVMSVAAVDITFYDKDGNEIEPLIPISVVMSVDEIDETQQALVVHVDDAGNAAVVEDAESSGDGEKLSLNVEMAGTEAADAISGTEGDPQKPSPLGKVDQPKAETDEVPVAAQSADDTTGDIIPGTEDDEGPHPTSQSPDTSPTGEGSETPGDIIPGTEDDEGPHSTSQSSATFPIGEGSEADETTGDLIPGTEADTTTGTGDDEGPHPTSQSSATFPIGEGSEADETTGDLIPGTEADTTTGTEADEGPHPTSQSPDTSPTGEASDTPAETITGSAEAVSPESTTVTFTAESFSVYAVVIIETRYIAASGETYEIKLSYDAAAGIPAGAALEVSEIMGAEGEAYAAAAAEALDGAGIAYAKALDIKIIKDGEELQPQAPVNVSIRLLDAPQDASDENLNVLHFGNEVEPVDCALNAGAVEFRAEGFSVYVVAYTVDFHYGSGEFDFSIVGGNTISMKELAARLHLVEVQDQAALDAVLAELHPEPVEEVIPEDDEDETDAEPNEADPASAKPAVWPQEIEDFVANIASIEWTNPDVATVAKVQRQTTVGDLVDSLGLVNQFSAEMTDSQIEAAMNVVLAEGDWAFISTQPFLTEETLTITMQNGDVYEIGVTDAQGYANVTLRNPTVNIKTGSETTSYDSNLNFALTTNGLARVTGKAVNTAGTYYYIPDKITYNGKQYQVNNIASLTPAAINGRCVVFDDDLCLHMLDAKQTSLEPVVDRILASMMVSSKLAKDSDLTDADRATETATPIPGLEDARVDELAQANGFVVGEKNETDGNLFELFKRAQYDEEHNIVTIELKYFQKMKRNVPLDFIFVYDDSGTMASAANNHANSGNQYNADGGMITYSASQSVWCRIALQVILKGIMDQGAKGYDIRMAPIAFASNAFYTPNTFYSTYVAAKEAIGKIYTSGGTEHYKALEDALNLATYSVNHDHRNPIVVYLSDFHSNANTTRAKNAAKNLRALKNGDENVQVYTIHMFEPNFRYDRNIATDTNHMFILNDTRPVSDLLGIFDTITKDAIGYYISKDMSVQDELSGGLMAAAQNVSINIPSANGSSAKNGSNTTWTFTSGEDRLQAGKIYSETIEVQLQDDVVFSPEMAANASAKVVKTTEDDNGGLHPNTVNEIENQPLPKKNLVMVLGRLDKSGTQTTDTIPNAQFTLSGGSNTTVTLTTDANGRLTVPTTFHFAEGSYTLTQLTTDDLEDETPKMVMPSPASWTITVDANGLMTADGGNPNMTVQKGKFYIWNKQYVEVMPVLIPVTVQKTWKGNGPKTNVPFTVYGISGDNRLALTAYDGANKKTAHEVTELTATNVTITTDGSDTVWTKEIYVPDRSGGMEFCTKASDTNYTSYRYAIEEGELASVAGGYYGKGVIGQDFLSETVTRTIYYYEGGWKDWAGSNSELTSVQIHFNMSNLKIANVSVDNNNKRKAVLYDNLEKVYVKFVDSNDNEEKIITFTIPSPDYDNGVLYQDIKLPTSWLTEAGTNNRHYYKNLTITQFYFIKTDGTIVKAYDENLTNKPNTGYTLTYTPLNGTQGRYRLEFERNGDNEDGHDEMSNCSTSSIKHCVDINKFETKEVTFNNSLILTMSNTFVPLRTLDITSMWKDSSTDAGSTGQIQSVTYEILRKDGENWVPAVGTDGEALSTDALTAAVAAKSGEANTYEAKLNLTLPEGEYKVRQASYTLSNGRVVSADDSGAFAPYRLTSPNDPNPTVDNTTRTNTYVWENTRKYFDATVRTVWSPELAADDDPTGGSGLPYKLSYRSYNGGTVEEHNEDGTSLKSEGWTHEHSHIPAYGVDGVETQIVLNASDALAIAYNTEITRTEDSETHQTFTITNTERRVTFSVRKDWLDAEGQYIPEAERQPVTIEIWGIERQTGGYIPGDDLSAPPSELQLPEERIPEPFRNELWNDSTLDKNNTYYNVSAPNPRGFFKIGTEWYCLAGDLGTLALNQFPNNVQGAHKLVKWSGRVLDDTVYHIDNNRIIVNTNADLAEKKLKFGDIIVYEKSYYIFDNTDSAANAPGAMQESDVVRFLGTAGSVSHGSSSISQTEYPHTTQDEVDTLITSEHASQFDAGTKRVKADGVTAEYTITADDGWTRSFELPARYVYFAREVKVGTLPLENEDNTENLENLAMFSPYYDYDQGAVTVAISNCFPIARVSNDGGANWKYFDTLLTVHAENYSKHEGAFNYANTLSGNVEIELLRRTNPFYTMKSGFTFDTPTSVTLRTTQDPAWNPGDTKFTSAIYRGYSGTSLITFSKAGGSFTVEKITLDGNKNSVKDEEDNEIASFTGSASGGLISITGATLNIRDGATLQNSKLDDDMDGGAVYAKNSTVSMTGGLIQNNEVVGEGGGIYLDGIINNEAQAAWRVYVANTGSSMTMTGGTIKGNKADLVGNTKGQGGGVYVSATGSLTMSGGSIEENTASMGGGVQTGYNGGFTMTGGTIARNIANSGGGICQWSDTPGTINGGTLTGNSATARGSAIYVVGGNTFNINGGRITDNNVAVSDGAVSIENGNSRLNFSGSAFVYGNVDGSAQKNVVLGDESSNDDTGNHKNGVIRMMGSFADEAHVGIWIPDALQAAHDQPAMPFGYYADATYENEEKFTSDRQPGLIAVMGTNHTLYWADYIARVKTDTGTDAQKAWKYFEALIDVKEGNTIVIPGAFNYAQTLGGNVVIETLKETHARYTLPESFTFSNSPSKTGVTLRTTEGAAFQTTLKRGYDEDKAGSLINVHDIDMTISNIAFDGNGKTGRAVEIGDTSSSDNIKHGTLTITNGVSFRNFNTAQRPTYNTSAFDAKGGVINCNQGTSLTITGTAAKPIVFENNTLTNTNSSGKMGADGGAICAEFDCEITINYAQFVNNTATSANGTDKGTGGAISLAGTNKGTTANKVKLTVSNSTFSGNSAKQEGGAIRAWDKTDVTLTNCTFTGNTATNGDGGAVFVQSTTANPSELKIYGGSFTGNTAANGTGGVVCFAKNAGETSGSGTLTIAKNGNAAATFGDGTDVGKNTAANGGAICVYGSTATVTDAVINKNSATNEGGGIKAYGGTLTVDGVTNIQNCTAAHGGGIHTTDTALTVKDNTEIRNCSVTHFGGGIYIHGAQEKTANQQKAVQITGSTKITNCCAGWNGTTYNATGDGGGVNIAFGASATIDGSVEISGCKAVYGGGVNVEWTFSQNICAGTIGGSVVITGCEAKTAGSGVYVYDHSSLTMSGGQIGGNTVSDSVGAVQVGGENARLNFSGNAKVTGNTYTSGESSVSKNVYLEQNNDLIINTSGLGDEALIGVHAKDGAVFTARGKNGKIFGSQTSTTNLNHFRNDVTGALGEDAGSGKVRWQLVSIPLVPVNVEKVWASAIPSGTTSIGFQIYGITNTTAGTKVALDAYDADIDTSDSTAVAAHKVTELKASEGWKKLVYVPQYGSDGTGNKIFFVDSDTGEYHYSIEELNKPEGYDAVETIIPGRTIPGETVEANTEVEVPVDTYTSYPYTFYAEFNVDRTYQGFFHWQDRYPVLRTMVISFSHKQNPEIKYTLHLDLTPTQTEGTGKYYVRVKSPTGYIGNYKLDSIVLNGGAATARNISLITQKQLDQLNVYSFVNSTPTKFTQVSTKDYELPSTVEPAVMRITNRIDQTLMVPLIIQKKWDLPIGKSYASVPFTVYGVKGTTETALTAYSVSVPTTGKEVTRLTESDTCPVPKDDGTGSETATWAKMVYVPRQNSAGENYDSYTVKEPNISTVDAKAVWDPEVTPAKVQWEEVTDTNEYTDAYIRLTRTGVGTNKTNEYTNISKVKFYFWDATKDNYYCSSLDFASSRLLSWNTSGTKYCLKIRVPKSLDLSGAQLMFDSYNGEHKPTVVDLSKEPSMKAGVDGDTYVYGIEAQAEKLSLPAFKMGTMDTHNPSFDDVVFLSTYDGSDVITGTQHLYTFPHVQPNARLIVTNHSYICKIVEKNGDTVVAEHGFTTLNKAVDYAREHGNGAAMSATNPVKIEMLVDYVIPFTDKVTLTDGDNITFTTAPKAETFTGEKFFFTPTFTAAEGRVANSETVSGITIPGDSDKTAILRRGFTGNSLIESSGTSVLTTRNIIFDGNRNNYTAGTRGGAIYAHGDQVYLYDTVIRNSITQRGENDQHGGGGAHLNCRISVVHGGRVVDCESQWNGGGICFKYTSNNNNDGSRQELNGTQLIRCQVVATDANGNVLTGEQKGRSGGGAYFWHKNSRANCVTVVDCHADNDKGGGLYFYGAHGELGVSYTAEDGSTQYGDSNFINCTARRGGGVQFYDVHTNSGGEEIDTELGTGEEPDEEVDGTETYHVNFKNCEAKNDWGGGIAFVGEIKKVSYMTFDSCKAKTDGGGIGIGSKGTLGGARLDHLTFTDCTAERNGGAIYIEKTHATSPVLSNITINGHDSTKTSPLQATTKNAEKGGGIYVKAGRITMQDCVILNSYATNGGAIYASTDDNAANSAIIIMNDAAHPNTITGNTAIENGAGIYLAQNTKDGKTLSAVLQLAGGQNFGGKGVDANGDLTTDGTLTVGTTTVAAGNFVTKTDYSGKNNGGKSYPTSNKVRQDIYIAETGAESTSDGTYTPASIIVTGDLVDADRNYIGDGTIWVWAENQYRYKQLMPFARANGVTFAETPTGTQLDAAHLKAFRNAQDDETTENGTDGYLFGTVEGEVTDQGIIYWTGSSGSRRVILRKVNSAHAPVKDMTFTVYKGTRTNAYVVKNKANNTPETLESLNSLDSGVIWIGDLPYGWYILKESAPDTCFYVVVTANGTFTGPDKGTNEDDARDKAKKLYDEKTKK